MTSHNPFRRAEDTQPKYDMDVFIDAMGDASGVGGGVANFLTGYVVYKGEKFAFEAIAYGRIGGQNVSPNLQPEAIKRLEEIGVEIEVFMAQLQRKMVEGEMTLNIPEGSLPPE